MACLLAGRRGLLLSLRDGSCRHHQQKTEMTKEMKSLGLGLRRYGCGSEGLSPRGRGRGGLLLLASSLSLSSSSSLFRSMSSSYSTSASASVSPRHWLVYTTTITTTKTAPFGTRSFGSSNKDESSQKIRNRNQDSEEEEHEKTNIKRTTASESGSENGSHARTDGDIKIEYPYSHPPEDIPSSSGEKGKGPTSPRTLQTFTLQGNVGVVTGGARGLGLVMGTGMVRSGADLALVDLNGLCSFLLIFPFVLFLSCFSSFPSVLSPVSVLFIPFSIYLTRPCVCERKECKLSYVRVVRLRLTKGGGSV